jgi:hypothetical protein
MKASTDSRSDNPESLISCRIFGVVGLEGECVYSWIEISGTTTAETNYQLIEQGLCAE